MQSCKGPPCDQAVACVAAGKCQYQSSAEIAFSHLHPKVVEDFTGTVDGKGVKQVMTDPKTGLEMISPYFLEGVGDVLTYGANKYARNNWLRGMSYATVFGGIMRHLWAWFRGEDIDLKEKGGSGLPHLYHAAGGIMFLIHYTNKPEYVTFDDRVFK